MLYGGRLARVPDIVVEPIDESEVRAIIEAAVEHGACLVPFGGGTNVSGALMCPEEETRAIVSIDMRRMRRVLSVDRANGCALVEAGITGADLEEALGAIGFTCGHTPDSIEFSTLGGWIATCFFARPSHFCQIALRPSSRSISASATSMMPGTMMVSPLEVLAFTSAMRAILRLRW